jgi:outer membrane protein assembly factor BamB
VSHTHQSLTLLATLFLGGLAAGADWPQFRGPTGNGISPDHGLPVTWGPGKNVLWKTRLPGPGISSPIVWGDRVFVACYTGHGVGGPGGDVKDLRRHLLCMERATGNVLWQKDVPTKLPETKFNNYLKQHGYVSSTPATDGERVYVFFGRTGVLAFDFDGRLLWQTEVGTGLNSWGSASSPVLYRDLVLVNASVECGALLALDRRSGKEVWRAKGVRDSWSTPLLVVVTGGKEEVVINTTGELLAFDAGTGARLWDCEQVVSSTPATTPVARDGIVYTMSSGFGGQGQAIAVRAGGRGDVSQTHVLWRQKVGANLCSPLLYGDHLYWVSGQAVCLRADTGAVVYRQRLYDTRNEYGSPVACDGKIFAFTHRQGTFVLAAGPRFEQLAHNDLEDDGFFGASPAVSNGQVFVRSNEYLYCIGQKSP